jgi:hypothetical protein
MLGHTKQIWKGGRQCLYLVTAQSARQKFYIDRLISSNKVYYMERDRVKRVYGAKWKLHRDMLNYHTI